jgi:hypothetical protein
MGRADHLSRAPRIGPARLHAWALAIQAGLTLAWAVFPTIQIRIQWAILPLAAELPARRSAAAFGIALLALAIGIGRRKRYAWAAALGLYLLAAALHALSGPAWTPLLFAIVLAGLLLAQSRVFIAFSQPAAARAGVSVWAAGLVLAAALGVIGLVSTTGSGSLPGPLIGAGRALVMFLLFFDAAAATGHSGRPPPGTRHRTGLWVYLHGAPDLAARQMLLLHRGRLNGGLCRLWARGPGARRSHRPAR